MSLRRQWRDLDRSTVGRAPERWGVYEVGDADGAVVDAGYGILRDELKERLAYGEAERVRWETADSESDARRRYEAL